MGKSNVNKDHYIEPHGRERQGEDIVQKHHKQRLKENEKTLQENYIPGAAPVGENKRERQPRKGKK
jgi:hypothetical protein